MEISNEIFTKLCGNVFRTSLPNLMATKVSIDIQNYIEKRANIRTAILNYLDGEENLEKDFNIFKYFNDQKVQEPTIFDLKKILNFIGIIIENHNRGPDFFTKIIEIISYFKDDIKKKFDKY